MQAVSGDHPHELPQISFAQFCIESICTNLSALLMLSYHNTSPVHKAFWLAQLMVPYHNTSLVHRTFWLVRTCLVWRAFLYIHQLFTLISKTCQALVKVCLAGAMLQVADDLVSVIKLLEEHPEVQLASIALPGLPSDVQGYVRGIETVMSGVRSTADAWDLALRYVSGALAVKSCCQYMVICHRLLWSGSPMLHARHMHDDSYILGTW